MEEILYTAYVDTAKCKKKIQIIHADVTQLSFDTDILCCSAFINDYTPTPTSLIGALYHKKNISVENLAQDPLIDMRDAGVWLSKEVGSKEIGHIACVEMSSYYQHVMHGNGIVVSEPSEEDRKKAAKGLANFDWYRNSESSFLFAYSSLFIMIRLAYMSGVKVNTIVLPVLGSGNQKLCLESSLKALTTECKNALQTIEGVETIIIADYSCEKAKEIANTMRKVYDDTTDKSVFISYSHEDSYYANYFAEELMKNGVKVWIDKDNIKANDFPGIIVEAILNARMFTILITPSSMGSKHVLSELANAFDSESEYPEILPVCLDDAKYNSNFSYYLRGKHYEKITDEDKLQQLTELAKSIAKYLIEA